MVRLLSFCWFTGGHTIHSSVEIMIPSTGVETAKLCLQSSLIKGACHYIRHQRTFCFPFLLYLAPFLCTFTNFYSFRLYFFLVSLFYAAIFSCRTRFMLHFSHVALYSRCTFPVSVFFLFCRFLALHLVHVALIHDTLFSSCIFSQVSLFSCVTCILLQSFPTALFITLYTFPIGFFHVAHFPCYMLYSFILHFLCCTIFIFHFCRVALFSWCMLSILHLFVFHFFHVAISLQSMLFLLHFVCHVTLFSYCTLPYLHTFFILCFFYAFSMLRSFEIALFHVA